VTSTAEAEVILVEGVPVEVGGHIWRLLVDQRPDAIWSALDPAQRRDPTLNPYHHAAGWQWYGPPPSIFD